MAFRAFEFLGFAETAGMRQRDAFEHHRVRGIGAGTASAHDQVLQEVERGPRFLVDFSHRSSGHFQIGLPDPGKP